MLAETFMSCSWKSPKSIGQNNDRHADEMSFVNGPPLVEKVSSVGRSVEAKSSAEAAPN